MLIGTLSELDRMFKQTDIINLFKLKDVNQRHIYIYIHFNKCYF